LATEAASITVVEIDPRAVAAMQELRAQAGPRLVVIEADALSLDLATLAPAPRQIIANLPYNIATPLLIRWLEQAGAFERLTLMFQQEVAERIVAPAGSAAYGRLAVLAQWLCRVELQLRVQPAAFVPPPKVWSAVVSFTPGAEQPPPELNAVMQRLTAAAFGQRRKMLRGALRALGANTLLTAAGIAGERRAETLTVAEFERLAQLLAASQAA
jgi:16S rRNA (adenine1518-N6/adenine1519-N6)-dimethyltransferase